MKKVKVKATDTGKFVTVYTEGEGKSDAVRGIFLRQ